MRDVEAFGGYAGHLGLAQEGEDPRGRLFRGGDQILIANAVARLRVPFLEVQDRLHRGHPVAADRGYAVADILGREGVEPEAVQPPRAGLDRRCDHIHAMPVKADELGLRVKLGDQVGVLEVVERLVAPPLLAAPPEIAVVGAPDNVAHRRQRLRADRDRGVQRPGLVVGVLQDVTGQAELRAGCGDAGLGRAGQPRVTVEDEPQQRRTRPARGQDEDRRLAPPGAAGRRSRGRGGGNAFVRHGRSLPHLWPSRPLCKMPA